MIVSAFGSTWSSPAPPSMMSRSPVSIGSCSLFSTPMTSGMPNARAMIAEWEDGLPTIVTIPSTTSGFRWMSWEGVSSRTTRMNGCVSDGSIISGAPSRCFSSRLPTSLMSSARSFMYSSSSRSNIVTKWSIASLTATSAALYCRWMIPLISFMNTGSSRIARCASKMPDSSEPTVSSISTFISWISVFERLMPSYSRSNSRARSPTPTLCSGSSHSQFGRTNALPIAMPSDAPNPWIMMLPPYSLSL